MRMELFGLKLTDIIPKDYFQTGELSLGSKSYLKNSQLAELVKKHVLCLIFIVFK